MNKTAKNVYRTYDKIAAWFDTARTRELMEKHYLDFLVQSLKPRASVMDLGCGMGEPIMRYLMEQGLDVTGVDASSTMLAIARRRFPAARFIESDMRLLDLKQRFDAIIAWHSFFHLPQDNQRAMFDVFARHVNSQGFLIFTSGPEEGEVWSDNGGEMLYHASLDSAEYRRLLEASGFQVLQHVVEDPECGGATVWVARRI